ncbi:uncharacterized protein LOC119272185 [Triticum dicoccoides]|uniref:uncharacterized protein LOC119272185 n=1 Tax=Triticum dicoccoides TaxID=85692 RepID=UPI0018906038|nr:uncharacterized protein LOC119272185 [Triticum dicoccoides]
MLVFHAWTGEELPILVSKASSSPLLEPPPAAVAGYHPQDPIVPITFLLLARFLLPASHLSPVSLDRRRATMSAAKFLPGATPPGSGCLRVVRAPASPWTRRPSLSESQQPRLLPCFTKFIAARALELLQRPMASAAPELCCRRRQQQQFHRRLPPLFPCARPPNPVALRLHRTLVPDPRGPRRPADSPQPCLVQPRRPRALFRRDPPQRRGSPAPRTSSASPAKSRCRPAVDLLCRHTVSLSSEMVKRSGCSMSCARWATHRPSASRAQHYRAGPSSVVSSDNVAFVMCKGYQMVK